jgi:hypothetical protein
MASATTESEPLRDPRTRAASLATRLVVFSAGAVAFYLVITGGNVRGLDRAAESPGQAANELVVSAPATTSVAPPVVTAPPAPVSPPVSTSPPARGGRSTTPTRKRGATAMATARAGSQTAVATAESGASVCLPLTHLCVPRR